jgi:ubiquinone biosynthesis monooxygenase Coq7
MISSAQLAAQVMKVNHAGEHGAVNIYKAQILMARFTAKSLLPELQAFKKDEERHRNIFRGELERRGLERCRSYWLCALGGYVLGLGTGLLGARAISITTVAVERVVLKHLHYQMEFLADDTHATTAISSIINEEQEHHDKADIHRHTNNLFGAVLSAVVSGATESVIWLGMRI